jgi:CubicO group peptidase (beta-lactamase class C family)
MSFGHTGYAGGSVWIDPEHGLFVILLTSRLDYRRIREFSALRSEVSTAALQLAGFPDVAAHGASAALNP